MVFAVGEGDRADESPLGSPLPMLPGERLLPCSPKEISNQQGI